MIGHTEKPCGTIPAPCKKPEMQCHTDYVPINTCEVKQQLPCHEAEAVVNGHAKLVAVPAGAAAAYHESKVEYKTNYGLLFAVAVVLFVLALIFLWVWNPRDLRDSNDPSEDCNNRSTVRYLVIALIIGLAFIVGAYAICSCKSKVCKKEC